MEIIALGVLWLSITFSIAVVAGVLGKRYGVEFPIALMASLIVIANVLTNKIIVVGSFTVPAATLVFSATFLITDMLSEKWGKRYAHRAIWAGFIANVFLALSVAIAIAWPAAEFAQDEAIYFAETLGMTWRIVIASIVAYMISQLHDVWAYHLWKKITNGEHLWIRNNASTLVSQLIDSVIFATIAFYGVVPLAPIIAGMYVVKVGIALLDTPFLYALVYLVDRVEKRI
jgi:uncharacterized integral membrane protein (TIGR00697 family)